MVIIKIISLSSREKQIKAEGKGELRKKVVKTVAGNKRPGQCRRLCINCHHSQAAGMVQTCPVFADYRTYKGGSAQRFERKMLKSKRNAEQALNQGNWGRGGVGVVMKRIILITPSIWVIQLVTSLLSWWWFHRHRQVMSVKRVQLQVFCTGTIWQCINFLNDLLGWERIQTRRLKKAGGVVRRGQESIDTAYRRLVTSQTA